MGWRARKRASAAAGSASRGRAWPGWGCAGWGGVERLDHAAVEESCERRVEEDGGGGRRLLEQEPVGEDFGGASAEREDDSGAAQSGGEGLRLELAEVRLAVGGEDGWDAEAGALLDTGVEVEEVPAEAVGEHAADRGFAGTHE